MNRKWNILGEHCLFLIEIFCNSVKVFTVTFGQFSPWLLNIRINDYMNKMKVVKQLKSGTVIIKVQKQVQIQVKVIVHLLNLSLQSTGCFSKRFLSRICMLSWRATLGTWSATPKIRPSSCGTWGSFHPKRGSRPHGSLSHNRTGTTAGSRFPREVR